MNELIAFFGGIQPATLFTSLACLLLLLLRGAFSLLRGILRAVQRRKSRRTQRCRELLYALPERENAYLRERLRSMQPEREDSIAKVKSAYIRGQLVALKNSPLSPAERLEVEELLLSLRLYVEKPRWTKEDAETVNGIFARTLKLSAKYDVSA